MDRELLLLHLLKRQRPFSDGHVLQKMSKKVGDDNKKIEQIASISANNDAEIGKLIANAMAKVKKEGVITVEEAKGTETTVEIVEGMQFDRGYISPYFVTNADKMEAVLERPHILIYDKKISNMKELLPILEKQVQTGNPLLIISEAYQQPSQQLCRYRVSNPLDLHRQQHSSVRL